LDVKAGCNRGGGAVTVTDPTLAFRPLALTKMACARLRAASLVARFSCAKKYTRYGPNR